MDSTAFEPKDWLRCNNCFVVMRNSKVPFFFSICSHIFCNKCLPKVMKKCPQCHTQNIRVIPLAEPLNLEIKHCFESTEKLAEQYAQATLFQTMQLSINSNRLHDLMDKKYARIKVEYQQISENNKRLQNQIRELEFQLEASNRNLCEIQNSSVMMTPHSNVSSLMKNPPSVSSCGNISSGDSSFRRPQFGYKPKLTPTKVHQNMVENSEFRIPSLTRVPRSIGSSSRSSNSSRGTPFSNFTSYNRRK